MDKLLKLLRNNARLTNAELAVMLGKSEAEVGADIEKLERDGVITGYTAIIDETVYDPASVTAMIELKVTPQSQSGYDDIARSIAAYDQVDSVRLMSGAYDILVSVTGSNIREISRFVAENLAAIDAVQSTTTHFLLRSYKVNGIAVDSDDIDERGLVFP